jgi:hypothetical protein
MGFIKIFKSSKSSKAHPQSMTAPLDYDNSAASSQAAEGSQHGVGEHKAKPRKRDVLRKYLTLCCPYRLWLRFRKLSREDKIVVGGMVLTGWPLALAMLVGIIVILV